MLWEYGNPTSGHSDGDNEETYAFILLPYFPEVRNSDTLVDVLISCSVLVVHQHSEAGVPSRACHWGNHLLTMRVWGLIFLSVMYIVYFSLRYLTPLTIESSLFALHLVCNQQSLSVLLGDFVVIFGCRHFAIGVILRRTYSTVNILVMTS